MQYKSCLNLKNKASSIVVGSMVTIINKLFTRISSLINQSRSCYNIGASKLGEVWLIFYFRNKYIVKHCLTEAFSFNTGRAAAFCSTYKNTSSNWSFNVSFLLRLAFLFRDNRR